MQSEIVILVTQTIQWIYNLEIVFSEQPENCRKLQFRNVNENRFLKFYSEKLKSKTWWELKTRWKNSWERDMHGYQEEVNQKQNFHNRKNTSSRKLTAGRAPLMKKLQFRDWYEMLIFRHFKKNVVLKLLSLTIWKKI